MKVQDSQLPFLVSGKFGNMVGRVINGKQFFSKPPMHRKRKPTIYQQQNRENFAMVNRFVKPIITLIRKYDEPGGRKGVNKVVSHIIRHAIEGDHPNQRINCSKVILGEGTLANPEKYRVESPAKGLLEFTWSMERMRRRINKSDRLFILVYNEATHKSQYDLKCVERREKLFQMDVSFFSGKRIEVWFGFSSSNGLLVSTSVYAGSIDVL